MKAINILFRAMTLLIFVQSVFFLYRGLSIIGSYEGLLRWMWIFKIITYAGVGVLCYYVFRIKKVIEQQGFFGKGNIRHLRAIGLLGLGLTVLNSLANACMQTWRYFKNELVWEDISGRFFLYLSEQVFDQSVIVYLLIISILLLTLFSKKALAVKMENESFI